MMAAPRLHLGHVTARSGVSEDDEEVEVLRSGVHDDDVENGNLSMPLERESHQQSGDEDVMMGNSRRAMDLKTVVSPGIRSPLSAVRSETSTPEADAYEAAMAALYASTNSEAVPGHQQASGLLQGRISSVNPITARFPTARDSSINSVPFHSTPNDDAQTGAGTSPSSPPRESFWSEEEMRRALRFFFMNPLEKYRVTHRFPWKLALQIIKIIIVTTQLIMFGDMRMSHALFSSKTQTALRHIFLANWTADRDMLIYPPPVPPFSVYEINNFYSHLTYAVKKYYILPNVSVATLVYDCPYDDHGPGLRSWSCPTPPALNLCVVQLKAAESHLANQTYHFDMRTVTNCFDFELKPDQWNSSSFIIQDVLKSHNITIQKEKFVKAQLSFKLNTIHLKRLQPANEPDCFHLVVTVVYDNTGHTGDILITLDTVETYIDCRGSVQFPTYNTAMSVLVSMLDAIVLLVCISSFILCLRAVIRARRLFKRADQFFLVSYGHYLSKDDSIKFINFWYLLILVNDVCLVMGTVFKLTIEYRRFDASLFTATGMLLGLGTLIVWAGVLRYLAFFPKYNVLIITLKRSLPNVLRFMACAGLLYAGFVFCGWVVLGPYHMKFRTLMMTSECLFALLNGDDMFATFATTSKASPAVLWFARLYLYTFISLFTYVVLSLFISIIMEAYEVMKDRQQYEPDRSDLEGFIGAAQLAVDNSAATGIVSASLLPGATSPSVGFLPRMRRRLSRQRSSHGDEHPYVRFENEPATIGDQDAVSTAEASTGR